MRGIFCIFVVFLLSGCILDDDDKNKNTEYVSKVGDALSINKSMSEEDLQIKNVVFVSMDDRSYYIGYRQASTDNKDPVLLKFLNGELSWGRMDYEITGDDCTGYGILYDGESLYCAFSVTGTQGDASEDFRKYAYNGWLSSYGSGGGAKAAVIAQIDPADGSVLKATYLYAKLSNGNTNSLLITGMDFTEKGDIKITADSWYSPLTADKRPMSCTGSSPFEYTVIFSKKLDQVFYTEAEGCN